MKKLETYLQALQAGAHEREIISGAIDALKSCTPQELSDYRLLAAAVYCQLLQYCQFMYKGHVPEEIIEELLSAFETIGLIGAEATDEEKKDSSLITVWFLHELNIRRETGEVWKMEDEMLRDSMRVLLQELNGIYFVFDIKVDGQYAFPIHDMIAKVVGTPEFVDINNPLGVYHIHILQLAVRLFTNSDDKQRILRTLVDQCNLRFIDYLNTSGYIIDTMDLLNYQKNGVMIFYDRMRNKVLVRHKSRDYFQGQPLGKNERMIIEEEQDHHKNIIGFFVEYDLDKSDSLTDYSEILKNEAGREAFLRLVFNGDTYNILFEHSIIEKADGSLLPVNPYCYNDATIVKGWRGDKNGRIYDKEHFRDALRRYRSSALKVSSNCVMNRVSFGLALLLLQKENTGVDKLRLDDFTDDDWYQNQILQNWTECCRDSIDALTFIVGQWQKENDYCALPYKRNKNSKEKNIEDYEIEPLDFYPVKSENGWMYQVMGCENFEEWYVLRGKVQNDNEGNYVLAADLVSDVVGKRFSENTDKKQLFVKTKDLEDPEGLLANIWGEGDEYYFLYNGEKQEGTVLDQSLLKALSAFEKIQDKNYLTLDTVSEISRTQYKEITAMMQLQKAALEDAGKRFFCDFDSQVYYRLVHNLLWSEIDKEKISSYLKVFTYHQKLSFAEIGRDEKFVRNDPNTLYVPKDGRGSDSVLTSIYETYLKSRSVRETNDLYGDMLELRDDGYYYRDNRIENIVFLCDNFECGAATIRMLKAYLNIDMTDERSDEQRRVEQVRASRQKYYLRETNSSDGNYDLSAAWEHLKEVPIKNVIKKNDCTIEVHGYYGTERGKQAIEEFLEKQHIKSAVVTYERKITQHASQIIDEAKYIWPRFSLRDNVYTVVREFNMPKANVFPEEMLKDPGKAICMFVKKDEIRKSEIGG